MRLCEKLAYFICPTLKAEVGALRDGNTKIVLENQKLMDKLASVLRDDNYIELPDSLLRHLSQKSQMEIADRRIRVRFPLPFPQAAVFDAQETEK